MKKILSMCTIALLLALTAVSVPAATVTTPTPKNGVVTITTAGTYNITGKLTQVVVAATSKDAVTLNLNNAIITNPTGAAIYASQCDKLTITLVDGTTNTVTDGGENFKYVLAADEEPNAAIFSKDDLTINGKGTLVVNAGFNNGIGTKDDLVIESGVINVTAVNNGIKGKDSVTINGGTFTIDSVGDAVHSNANVTISNGSFTIRSGDDGVHADGDLTVKGGTINVTKSYEGLEGNNVTISGGTVTVVASDDGINAAGGADGSGFGGGDKFAVGGTSHAIKITGGIVTVYSGSDGLDSNGTITVTGGTVAVFIYAPRDGEVLDADSTVAITPALFGGAVTAGTKLSIVSGGNTLWSGTAANAATSYAFIIPGLTNGTSYIVQTGTASSSITATTSAPRMGMGGGMQIGGGQPGGGHGGRK